MKELKQLEDYYKNNEFDMDKIIEDTKDQALEIALQVDKQVEDKKLPKLK